ncbi:hypothetical protein DIPPA_25470 [Diplonema papillatum]|nr:hypothetical protein DIPPA_25470 [Diplonema papillatum]
MARGSIKHDHAKKGLIPHRGKLDVNRKAIKKQKQRLVAKTLVAKDVEASSEKLKQEGQLVPLKQGKLIKATERPQNTPPPHQSFRQNRQKLSQAKMSVIVRQSIVEKVKARRGRK